MLPNYHSDFANGIEQYGTIGQVLKHDRSILSEKLPFLSPDLIFRPQTGLVVN